MNIIEIEKELIVAISDVQNESGEQEVFIDKNTRPFNLPDFDSIRFCEAFTNLKFDVISFAKLQKKLTIESTIHDIAEEIYIQIDKGAKVKV